VAERRWVVPPEDPDTLAGAIVDCLSDSRILNQMISGVEKIAKSLDWNDIAEKTMQVYNYVLKQKNFDLQRR